MDEIWIMNEKDKLTDCLIKLERYIVMPFILNVFFSPLDARGFVPKRKRD